MEKLTFLRETIEWIKIIAMYNEKEMIAIIEDDYPIDPSGTTRANQIAYPIGTTGEHKDEYQNLFIEIIQQIPYRDWSFVVKVLSFVTAAKFDRSFYEAFAAYIKEHFSETNPGEAVIINKAFLRGRCIEFIAKHHKDLFNFEWIKKTSLHLSSRYPWAYLDILKLYEPEHFLLEMDVLLEKEGKNKENKTSLILNYTIQLADLYSEEELLPYIEKWKIHMSTNNHHQYKKVMKHYLDKKETLKTRA